MTSMTKSHSLTRGQWRFKWEGGRLADVYHVSKPEYPIDCIQVGEYDWQKGEGNATRHDLEVAADEWIKESSTDYLQELPYL